eukprot:s1102_g21.t1
MAGARLATALLITMAAAQTFMQRREEIPVLQAPQEPEIPRLTRDNQLIPAARCIALAAVAVAQAAIMATTSDPSVSPSDPVSPKASFGAEAEVETTNFDAKAAPKFSLVDFGASEIFEDLDNEASVRASPLGTVTSGCGRHWSLKADIEVEDVTVPSQYYDAFLSHEWGSSGFLKVLTILMIYNLRAATAITLLSSLLFGVLRVYEILPDNESTVVMGYCVFFFVMTFWQRIRECFRKPHLFFVDKLCIEQKDAKAKTQGILSLAAYLKRSKTLLIMWSPQYFQRLWCTFELVSFLREQDVGVRIMPVKMVVLLVHLNLTWQLLRVTLKVLNSASAVQDNSREVTSFFLILTILGTVVMPIYHWLGLRMMIDIQRLPQQLNTFKIQDSKCTCCSINHKDPQTGQPIACDRKLVLWTLKKWKMSEDEEDYLEAFNELVRQNLVSIFVETLQGSFLPFGFYVQMAICANSPWLADLVSELYADLQSLDPSIVGIDLVFFIINKVLDFLNVYVVMIILARSSFTIWRMSVPLLRYLPQWLLCFMLIPPMLPIGVVSVSIAYLPLYFFPPTSPFPSACFLVLVITLPTSHMGLLDELERLVERRERAMERTSWALGMLCVVALTSAGLSARSMLRNKAD